MGSHLLEIREAIRRLWRRPAYFAACTVSLALGASATAVGYSLLERLLLAPAPGVHSPEELFRVTAQAKVGELRAVPFSALSFPQYSAMQKALAPSTPLGAYLTFSATVSVAERPVETGLFLTSYEAFSLLGVEPALGRGFTEADDRASAPPVALLGYGVWQSVFSGEASVLGKTLTLREHVYTIVGVLPEGFDGLDRREIGAAIPLRAAVLSVMSAPDILENRLYYSFQIVGRASDLEKRSTNLASYLTSVFRGNAVEGPELDPEARVFVVPLAKERIPRLQRVTEVTTWLLGLSAIMLLLGCLNVAMLVTTTALSREHEFRTRMALGAPWFVLGRLVIVEAMFIAVASLAFAWCLSAIAQRLITSTVLSELRMAPLAFSGRAAVIVLWSTLILTMLGALMAWRILHHRIGGSGTIIGNSRSFGRSSFIERVTPAIQAALTVLLLVAGVQFAFFLIASRTSDLGIDVQRLAAVRFASDGRDGVDSLYSRATLALELHPEIEGIATLSAVPFGRRTVDMMYVDPPARVPSSLDEAAGLVATTPSFDHVLGLHVLRGRSLEDDDNADAPRVVVINQAMAQAYWPEADPIGRCIRFGAPTSDCTRVVGIVSNYRTDPVKAAVAEYYVPLAQSDRATADALLIRTRAGATGAQRWLTDAVVQVVPSDVSVEVQPLTMQYARVLKPWSIAATTLTLLGVVALIIALLGAYSSTVLFLRRERTSVAVRVAIGAPPRLVATSIIIRHGVALVLGITAGVLAFGMTRGVLANISSLNVPANVEALAATVVVFVLACGAAMIIPIRTVLARSPRELLFEEQ